MSQFALRDLSTRFRWLPTNRETPPVRRSQSWIATFVTALVLLFIASISNAIAQEPPPPTTEASEINEQTIYVPYDKLREVFEREGRGVFLPYDKFQELWSAAQSAKIKPPVVGPPVEAMIVSAESEATVEKEVMVVRATLSIELLKQGWHRVPIRLNDSAILSATIDSQPARVVPDPSGYAILVEKRDNTSNLVTLKLEYAKAFYKSPGQNSVAFASPQAPVNRWRIRISDAGVKLQIQPMIAATETTSSDSNASSTDSNNSSNEKPFTGTELLAFVGAAPEVRINWVPKAEGATGLTALASVDSIHQVTIDEGIMRTSVQLHYTISRAELNSLLLLVPADQKIVNVFDPNIRKWTVDSNKTADVNTQSLSIELFEPATQSQNLTIELEQIFDQSTTKELRVAPISASQASRQQGTVAIRINSALRAEPTERTGLLQMDGTELPESIRNQSWNLAYRYSAVPFALTLRTDKVLPTINVSQLVQAYVEPEQISLDLMTIHTIENAGVFELDFEIPIGFEIRQVIGSAFPEAAAASIDNYRVTGDKQSRLVISLSKKAIGKIGTIVRLQQKLSDPNLLSPTGSSSSITVPIPRAIDDSLTNVTGQVLVMARESLRVVPAEKKGIVEAWSGEISQRWQGAVVARPGFTIASSFTSANEPVTLVLNVERRKPMFTAREFLDVNVEPGLVKFEAKFFTDVQFSSLPAFRIDVPESLAKDIRIETPGVRETVIEPSPADLESGMVAWSVASETTWFGSGGLTLSWQTKLDDLEIGKTVLIPVPKLAVRGADRFLGQIALHKSESIDLSPDQYTGLRPIDPRYDLMAGVSAQNAASALEFQSDWTLSIGATRYALENVKRTSIERAFVRAVITRSSQTGVYAAYRIRSAQQRIAIELPAESQFDTQPLKINGETVTLERGANDRLFIPLANRDPNRANLVELRYTVSGTEAQIDLPSFPDDPAVQATYLAVYLPREKTLLASNGPWTEEFQWIARDGFGSVPMPSRSDENLIRWVSEGINTTSSTAPSTDGTMYLYSTINPAPPPDGSLRLVTLGEKTWSAIIIIPLVLIGLFFATRPFYAKLIVIALVIGAMVLCGVFVPTMAHQLINSTTASAAGLVLLLWVTLAIVSPLRSRVHVARSATGKPKPSVASKPEEIAESTTTTSGQATPQDGDSHSSSNSENSNGDAHHG